MMDIKEIIKWFIPCFHILRLCLKLKIDMKTFVFLILLFNLAAPCLGAEVSDNKSITSIAKDSNLNSYKSDSQLSQSYSFNYNVIKRVPRKLETLGRTFGRPFIKKAIAGLIPLAFQMGAASTWAVVAALIGFKTLLVAGAILKLLLLAGAAKIGAYFSSKPHGHHEPTWDPQKQIHLHIHNGHHETHDEHLSASPWSRIGDQHIDTPSASSPPANVLQALQAYSSLTTTTQLPNWLNALQAYITPATTTPSPINVLQAIQAYVNTVTTTPSPLNMLQMLAAAQPANLLQALQQQSYAGNVQNNLAVPGVQQASVVVPLQQHTGPQTINTPFGTYLKIDKRGPAITE